MTTSTPPPTEPIHDLLGEMRGKKFRRDEAAEGRTAEVGTGVACPKEEENGQRQPAVEARRTGRRIIVHTEQEDHRERQRNI